MSRRGQRNSPEHRAKISKALKEKWEDPEYRANMSDALKESRSSEEARANRRSASARNWDNPEYVRKLEEAAKTRYTPEVRAIISEKMKERWQDPEYREIHGGALSEETRRKISEARRRNWEDPDYAEKIASSRRTLGHYHSNGYFILHGHKDHPLADKAGNLAEHRKVLYDKIGPGPHPCHWNAISKCGKLSMEWGGVGGICVDHLDDVKTNNDPLNLVPSCRGCNGSRRHWNGI